MRDISGKMQLVTIRGAVCNEPVKPLIPGEIMYLNRRDSSRSSYFVLPQSQLKIAVVAPPKMKDLPYARFYTSTDVAYAALEDDVAPDVVDVLNQHLRYGHAGEQRLRATLKEQRSNLSEVPASTVKKALALCKTCPLVKHTSASITSKLKSSKASNFNDKVYVDHMYVKEAGSTFIRRGGANLHWISGMSDEASGVISLMPLPSRGEAYKHMLFWIDKYGCPKKVVSDNAPELVEGRFGELLEKNNIVAEQGPPYTSQHQGDVERLHRTVRMMMRCIIHQYGFPKGVWPLLCLWISETFNKTVKSTSGMSPHFYRYRAAPNTKLMPGDWIIATKPKSPSAPKTLDPTGTLGIYMGTVHSGECIVIQPTKDDGHHVFRVHPARLKPAPKPVVIDQQLKLKSDSDPDKEEDPIHIFPITVGEFESEVTSSADQVGGGNGTAELVQQIQPSSQKAVETDISDSDDQVMDLPVATETSSSRSSSSSDYKVGDYCRVMFKDGTVRLARISNLLQKSADVATFKKDTSDNKYKSISLTRVNRSQITNRIEGIPDNFVDSGVLPPEVESSIYSSASSSSESSSAATPSADTSPIVNEEEAKILELALATTDELAPPPPYGANHVPATEVQVKAKLFDKAMEKEFNSWITNGVIGEQISDSYSTSIGTRWLLTWKLKTGESVRSQKARLIVLGHKDKRQGLETFSGTPNINLQRLVMIYALCRQWKVAYTDVTTAFLQADLPKELEVVLQLPDYLPDTIVSKGYLPQRKYKIKRAAYGLREAPYLYTSHFKEIAKQYGYIEVTNSILVLYAEKDRQIVRNYLRQELATLGLDSYSSTMLPSLSSVSEPIAILLMYVDDLTMFADTPVELLDQFQERVQMDSPRLLNMNESLKLIGINFCLQYNRLILSHQNFLNTMELQYARKNSKVSVQDLQPAAADEVDLSLVTEYRSCIGKLGWIVRTRPDLSFLFSELSKYNTSPCIRHMTAIHTILQLVKEHTKPLVFESFIKSASKRQDVLIRIYSDASYDLAAHVGKTGWLVQLLPANASIDDDRNVFAWSCNTERRKLASTTSAELIALYRAIKQCFSMVRLAMQLFVKCKVSIQFVIDSMPLYNQLCCGQTDKEPRLQGVLDYCIQSLLELHASVSWVDTHHMKADMLTKLLF